MKNTTCKKYYLVILSMGSKVVAACREPVLVKVAILCGILTLPLGLVDCQGTSEFSNIEQYKSHSKKEWLQLKEKLYGINYEAAVEQDRNISESQVPHKLRKDRLLRKEAVAIWRDHCAVCHGPQGQMEGVPEKKTEPREFGTMGMSMGFFFGGDKMRAGIYRKIRDGSGDMSAFKNRFSREQIWALVFYIEDL